MAIVPKRAVQEIGSYKGVGESRAGAVRMDFNENTAALEQNPLIQPLSELVSFYPEYQEVLQQVGELFGVDADNVLLTNGSDEALAVIATTFVEPGESVALVSTPSFFIIGHSLRIAGARLVEVPTLDDLEFDVAALTAALEAGADIAIFASPDNPTGSLLDLETIESWLSRFPDTLFVIDEAYCEYAGQSALPLLSRFSNLLVTRTFSKAWALAGLRLGVIIGAPELIEYLGRVRLPYSVNSAAVAAASGLLKRRRQVEPRGWSGRELDVIRSTHD